MRKRFISVLLAVLLFTSGLYIGAQNASMIPTFTSGQILTAAELNAMGDGIREALILVGLVQEDTLQLQSDVVLLENDVAPLKTLSTGAITVVDASGVVVGQSIGISFGDPIVTMSLDGYVFPIEVRQDRLRSDGQGSVVWFESADCSEGPRLGQPSTNKVFSHYTLGGSAVYVLQDINAEGEEIPHSSWLDDDGDCHPLNGSRSLISKPAKILVDLDDLFTPPFSIVRRND